MQLRHSYDIIILADLRFRGGTSTAVLNEIEANRRAGYRTALVPIRCPIMRFPHPFHPGIRAVIDAGVVDLVPASEPMDCGLLLIHHPQLFENLPVHSIDIRCDQALTIVHHPPFNGYGKADFEVAAIHQNATLAVGRESEWAPISPIVRDQFARLEQRPPLLGFDWYNVLDPQDWFVDRKHYVSNLCCIGRHSRPDLLKWPESRAEILEAYPQDDRFRVRVLGGGQYLFDLMQQSYPENWEVSGFDAGAAEQFLSRIDFFVYYHHPRWIEAFGRTVLEALASGTVAILPDSFRSLFDDAAVYATRSEAPNQALALRDSPEVFKKQSQAGIETVHERFSLDAHVRRIRALVGEPTKKLIPATAKPKPRKILFMSSNGIGMGHLTRLLAIAKRLPPNLQPVFLTMSQAMRVVEEQGFLAEFTPFHSYTEADNGRWNHFLAKELIEIFGFYDPAAIVFDGNMPYGGLLEALKTRPQMHSMWVRRGFWRKGSGANAITRESAFDAVIEPGDIAKALDVGLTTEYRGRTFEVSPLCLLDAEDRLSREEACIALGLNVDIDYVLLSLGSGNNFDYNSVLHQCIARIAELPNTEPVLLRSMIADNEIESNNEIKSVEVYPANRYINAFTSTISAVGYNSYHELLTSCQPSLFVPNEHPMMDEQLVRARFAECAGLALCCRTQDPYDLDRKLTLLFDENWRASAKSRMKLIPRPEGAIEAARLIAEMATTVRADRPRL